MRKGAANHARPRSTDAFVLLAELAVLIEAALDVALEALPKLIHDALTNHAS
jgi:hypothetical protein